MNDRQYDLSSEVRTPMCHTYHLDTIETSMPVSEERKICPAEKTLQVIGGRWKVPILWHLFQGTLRFSELRRALDGVTQKMSCATASRDGARCHRFAEGLSPDSAEGGVFADRRREDAQAGG